MAPAVRDESAIDHDSDRLRQKLLAGLAFEPGPVADDAFFDALPARIRTTA